MKYFESYLRILRLLQAFFLGLVNWLNYTCTLIGSYIKMWQVRHGTLYCASCATFLFFTHFDVNFDLLDNTKSIYQME